MHQTPVTNHAKIKEGHRDEIARLEKELTKKQAALKKLKADHQAAIKDIKKDIKFHQKALAQVINKENGSSQPTAQEKGGNDHGNSGQS